MFKRRYFIVAPNFHGTTLVSKLLNDHPKVVSLGDTYPSNRLDQVCGCGEPVSRCDFWNHVAQRVGAERYRDYPHLLPDYPHLFGKRVDRLAYNGLSPSMLRRVMPHHARETFADDFTAFETAVHDNAGRPGATVFVDAVKSVSRVYALIAAGIRVDGVIHLRRAPGDYIGSTMRKRGSNWRVFLNRLLVGYRFFHWAARRIRRQVPYLQVTYEGLTNDPDATMQVLFDFIQVPAKGIEELVNQERDQPWHFMGNASLFHFDGTIRRSRHELSAVESRCVDLLAGTYDASEYHLQGRA